MMRITASLPSELQARVSKNAVVEARKNGIKVGLIRPITLLAVSERNSECGGRQSKGFYFG